jgi:hypothetical protein
MFVGRIRRITAGLLSPSRTKVGSYPGEDNEVYQSRKTHQDDPNLLFGELLCDVTSWYPAASQKTAA